ncbi:MAG: response regulator [Planctomycetes bacterium]|nr:response regulator [Planctomycetota bacterium]
MKKNKRSPILVVDDEERNRILLSERLGQLGYESEGAADGYEALAKLKLGFDLVFLDAKMSGLDGYEVLDRIRNGEHSSDIPVVMVTGLDSATDRERAESLGADDFIAKPIDWNEVGEVLEAHLGQVKKGVEKNEEYSGLEDQWNDLSKEELRNALRETAKAQREAHYAHQETVKRLAIASEYRDEMTGAHVQRIGKYCTFLGELLHLPPGEVETLNFASRMHDMGKIGIPDKILLKPGKLSSDEWEIMKSHTEIGARILGGSDSKVLQGGETIARTHHEQWDGSGYPEGLEGEDIPLFGRICAVADVYDALSEKRPYRDPLPESEALEIMKSGRGAHFDPEIFDLFIENLDQIREIKQEFQEAPQMD